MPLDVCHAFYDAQLKQYEWSFIRGNTWSYEVAIYKWGLGLSARC
ncbi:MAG: hypothetical protein N3E36_04315 [Sulfolobales archaeon]|nr:hypothetical protein [Sulfolobales archaeon]MCX8199238.1 hypothetical protein [Sulfolobales archaeon]MDW8170448.1 hypothetical protein [Desulfurococcaceae archaeon]